MNDIRLTPPPLLAFVRFMDRLNSLLIKLCGLAFVIMVISIFIGILVRFVFSHMAFRISVPWTEELARYLLIWAVFVAGAVGTRTGQLIGIDILIGIMPAPIGRFAKYLVYILSIAFYMMLVWIGLQWTEFGQMERSPVMDIQMSMIFAAMAVGGALMVLNTLALMIEAHLAGRDIRHATYIEAELDDLVTQYQTEDPNSDLKK